MDEAQDIPPINQFNPEAFTRSVYDFARPTGPDLLGRTQGLFDWTQARREALVWPFCRSLETAPSPWAAGRDDVGRSLSGLNFGSQDYLGLSSHPAIKIAAMRALEEFGPHSASSGVLQGNTRISLELRHALGEFLHMRNVMLFPTGWAAGFGTIVGLIRPYDYVVMDNLAHACLQQGANAATQRVLRHGHLDIEGARKHLQQIRAEDASAGILVVTEGLFSMDSDMPRLDALQAACREYGAILFVDVAHDLGALGPGGTGALGAQNLLGKVDLVMGAFSKTFASNGGFLASGSAAAMQYVQLFGGSWTFSNAISPIQAAVVLEALRIVASPEGAELRARAMTAIHAMRDAFSGHGMTCLGDPSPIVPVLVGEEAVGRLASRLLRDRGVMTNLVEFPGVAIGKARFRMQVMASHNVQQVTEAAEIVSSTVKEAREIIAGTISKARFAKLTLPRKHSAAATQSPTGKSLDHSVSEFLAKGERRRYNSGERIIREDESAQSVFLIRNGKVQVQRDHLGSPVPLGELGPGEIFGEISFLTGATASATVVALGPVEVDALGHVSMAQAITKDAHLRAEFYRHLATNLATRLCYSNEERLAVTADEE